MGRERGRWHGEGGGDRVERGGTDGARILGALRTGGPAAHPGGPGRPPPKGYASWTGSLVAERLGDVSTEPEFARKAADIVGLYLDPPENALVLCVDEKPHIQALELAQGWLRLPNGKAQERALPLHADARLVAEPDRDMVQPAEAPRAQAAPFHAHPAGARGDRCLRRSAQ